MKVIIALVLLFCFAYGLRIRPSEQTCSRLPEKWQKACLAAIKFGKSKVAKTESDFLGAIGLGMKAFKAFKAIKAMKKQKKQKKQQEQPESDFLGAIGLGMKAFKAFRALRGLKKQKKQKKQQEQPESDVQVCINTKYGKFCYSRDAVESDAEFFGKIKKWWDNKGKNLFEKGKNLFNKGKEIYAILKNKPESDAEFGKFFKKIGGIAKKGFDIYKKVKSVGILSDAEFLSKLKNWWNTKGKNMFEKGKNLFNKGKEIYAILKNKPESDAEFLSKLKNWWNTKGKNLYNKGKEYFNKGKEIYAILKNKSESDAEFGKFLKKVGGIAKKGFDIYKKAKSFGIFSDEEEAKPAKKSPKWAALKKLLISKIQKRLAAKKEQGEQKPKRKFDIKALIAKIQKKRAEKKQKKEKKVEEPQQVNDQASG